jgi:hypothetical protein
MACVICGKPAGEDEICGGCESGDADGTCPICDGAGHGYAGVAPCPFEATGLRIPRQEHIGYAVDMSTGTVFLGSEKEIGNHGWAPTPERRVWRDLP